MHFNVTLDAGARVEGYLVPDSMRTTPNVRVADGDDEMLVLEANVAIPSLIDAGRHETGLCGFVLDETIAPGLAGVAGLTLSDAESGVMIYRRPRPGDAKCRGVAA